MTALDDLHDVTSEVRRLVGVAQAEPYPAKPTVAQLRGMLDRIRGTDVGPIVDWTNIIDGLADQLGNVPPPPPPPPPPPAVQFVPPLAYADGIYGRTKWMPGNGCDIFCPRGTNLLAPADCVVEEVIPGQGINGGAEIILAIPGNSWAWRYRHNQAAIGLGAGFALAVGVSVGSHVKQGQTVANTGDTSLDMLGAIPNWAVQQAGRPFPDGWQHLDLSVNQGTDQFSPLGGGGGNVSSFAWLQSTGYQGTVIQRTPGPPDAGRGFVESVRMFGRAKDAI